MKSIIYVAVAAVLLTFATPAMAQGTAKKEAGEQAEPEKSNLGDAERQKLSEMSGKIDMRVSSIEPDSTSRKIVKFAMADVSELSKFIKKLIESEQLEESEGDKLTSSAENMATTLSAINAKLKAGETDDVERMLPKLASQSEVLKQTVAELK